MELVGWAWYSPQKKALNIGLKGEDNRIDDEKRFVIFAEDLKKVKNGVYSSAKIYKHEQREQAGEPSEDYGRKGKDVPE